MARRKRTPEEEARRTKNRELLQESNVSRMEDIQNLFKETIAEFMETGLDAELYLFLTYFLPKRIECPTNSKPLRHL